jgi:hypothetical protein
MERVNNVYHEELLMFHLLHEDDEAVNSGGVGGGGGQGGQGGHRQTGHEQQGTHGSVFCERYKNNG